MAEYKYHPRNTERLRKLVKNPKVDLSEIDVSKISDFSNLFHKVNFADLRLMGIEQWDVSNAVDMSEMFVECDFLDLDLSKWDTCKVKNFHRMFAGSALYLDLSSFNVSSGRDFSEMFIHTRFYEDPKIENWQVNKGEDFTNMFRYDTLEFDLSGWKVSDQAKTEGFVDYAYFFDEALPPVIKEQVMLDRAEVIFFNDLDPYLGLMKKGLNHTLQDGSFIEDPNAEARGFHVIKACVVSLSIEDHWIDLNLLLDHKTLEPVLEMEWGRNGESRFNTEFTIFMDKKSGLNPNNSKFMKKVEQKLRDEFIEKFKDDLEVDPLMQVALKKFTLDQELDNLKKKKVKSDIDQLVL